MKPANFHSRPEAEAAIRDLAARWVVRRDRQLSAEETAELAAWLAADARHAAAFDQSSVSWRTFRELGSAVRRAPEPASAPAARARWRWAVPGGLAAAALVALAFVSSQRAPQHPPANVVANTAPAVVTRRLADGSVARLRAGAEIAEAFTAAERRIRLVRGEAFFVVAKDAARPFFVEVGGVTVRAVGTAFAVRFEPHAVDVLVTEGTVQVTPARAAKENFLSDGAADATVSAPVMVGAGHRAVVARVPEPQAPAVVVSAISATEMARTLAWNEPMLELAGATLSELVAAFAERSGRRIEVGDPALGAVRIGGRFPTDDVEGFVRALEEIYDVKSERRADGAIVLRKGR
ncbi:MAG: FecR domain-containing protein [Opitutaceae bacterium]|nr:FecR domain-containing protein [Opitutaceae bacterium]